MQLAERNLLLQREPVDWWLALTSAQQSGDVAAWRRLQDQRRASGLHDQRLDNMPAPNGPAKPKVSA